MEIKLYRSEIRTRPDGTSYVQCIWIGDQTKDQTREQQLIATQLKDWNTTE
jgi:hypothetical protein